jgi:hypothetical protein
VLGHSDPDKSGAYPGLEKFAEKKGAWFEKWLDSKLISFKESLGPFSERFHAAAHRASAIHFALDDTGYPNLASALASGAKGWGGGPYTNVELYEILRNRAWYDKTTFYFKGEIVNVPFQGN